MQKYEKYKNILTFGFNFLIWCVHVGIWAYFWDSNYASKIFIPFGTRGTWFVFAMYGIISYFFTKLYGGYRMGYYRRDEIILSGIIAVIFTNAIVYFQVCLIERTFARIPPFVWMTFVHLITYVLWACVGHFIYCKLFPPHRMLMVYGGGALATRLVNKMANRTEKYRIEEVISTDVDEATIIDKMVNYPAVILCDMPSDMRNRFVKLCFNNNIRAYITPKISDILLRSAVAIELFDSPLLLNRNSGLTLEQRFLKRAMDIALATVAFVLAAPFILVTAILVKLQDGGPVIFKQARATMDNKAFTLYKFRSMIVDAEKDGKPHPATDNDSRITPVGRFIRKTRLDELPQLWNILVGDMSIVGPRPERLEHVEKYTEEVQEFTYRLKVRAGLTGYAQVFGKYNTSALDKLKMDLMYIASYSLILDLKIILMTIKTIFSKESTEGM